MRDLVMESSMSLVCVIGLAAVCVALNRDGIGGNYIVSAVLQALVKYLGHVSLEGL
jgi:hypothetical protein